MIYLVALKIITYFLKTGLMFESSLFGCIGNLNHWGRPLIARATQYSIFFFNHDKAAAVVEIN